ncbi:MAG: SGNH/GDSL hydrolase family protein [Clostridia bacterium]|nr:SGNH/GDSL hydrolase family protein [Clostridia bacterium]
MRFKDEKPLDNLVGGYSYTSLFRTIGFVGDSLSSGEFEDLMENGERSYYDMLDYSWGQFIARKNGLKAYNFSRGGMTAKEYIESFAEKNGFWDKEKACQAYVIALGENDIINMKGEIGSTADIDKSDYRYNKPTFIGYYAQIVSRYKEINPNAKFFFVTFPNNDRHTDKAAVEGMAEALYELADFVGNAYVIDLYKYGPHHDEEYFDKYYLLGHLSPAGYLETAKIIDSYIDYIIRHNFEDFKMLGLERPSADEYILKVD